MKVSNFYNKNQFVILGDNGEIIFQSYNSEIAKIGDSGELVLGIDWDYSNTTLKHLYLFLYDYYFKLNKEIQEVLNCLNQKPNKKAYIQKLIDNKKIKYDVNMR